MSPSPSPIQVIIEYSEPAQYQDRAQHLAERLRDDHDFEVEVELVKSTGMLFEVSVQGRLIYSRRATRRFPEVAEIAYHVQAAQKKQGKGS